MDKYKFSTISHTDLIYANPISVAKMEEVIAVLDLPPNAQALDIGCGKSELLIRLIKEYNVFSTGVDRSPNFLQQAHVNAANRVPPERLKLLQIDVADFQADPASYDFAACIGATEVFGGYTGTVKKLAEYIKPGGLVLVGDGYWKKEPDPEYLAALAATRDEYNSHARNVAIGVEQGLVPLYAVVASDDEWDRYEWLHARAIERYAQQNPQDPDVPALLERIRTWRDLYLKWGRDTLGFGLYLFQK